MNKAARSLVLTLLMTLFFAVSFPAATAQEMAPNTLGFEFQEHRLRNGLRVILSVDGRLPLVTVAVAYGAGTIREQPGQEGLAYLLENLMFQGSENVGPLQHIGFVQKVGGDLNATTTPDRALFYQTLPSNYLALALWLESDRMKSLAITPAAIEKTRADLLKEHQDRLASDPYFESFALFDSLLYPDFPYGHPLIGAGMEMRGLTESDVLTFHRTYYVPDNAVLCIVGNIDIARTRELVARYFDSIPPGMNIPAPPLPVFKKENDAVVRFAGIRAAGAGFHMGFRFYPLQAGDVYSLRILEYLLLKGETSRLRNRLLRRDLTARYLSGALEERLSVSTLKVFCLNTNAVMAERSQKAILSEIDKLRTNPVSQDELNKAKRRFKMDYLNRLSTRLGRALFLVDAALAGTGLASLEEELDNYLRVSPPALTAFVNKYFTPQNRVVVEIGPQ
ncbi:MAG TPA: pitrilysin family protein [Candidatus Latescibacteria bacterium]|nr:pitrilysin family protein [Candidatus Latescibacterota bacterium]